MRLLARLRSTADAAYMNNYHHKLRGRLWQALKGTRFDDEHSTNDPVCFAYSNPFPPGDLKEGDERTLLVSSPHEDLLGHVARDFQDNPALEIGSMLFEVQDLSALEPDVGEPGTRGTLETGTGVLVRIPEKHRKRYGIEGESPEEVTFWRPEHSMRPFKDALQANLQHKHDLLAPSHHPGPEDRKTPLFDGYDLIKTYALPIPVTTEEERTFVVSKWRFDYTIQDNHHRRWLNLSLDAGLGGRNGLGFGFLNITEQTHRRERANHREVPDAHT